MRCGRWISAVGVALVVGVSGVAKGSSSATADGGGCTEAPNERAPPAPAPAPPALDLNTATIEQLDGLPGVGRKRAEAIIAQRQKRPFTRVTEELPPDQGFRSEKLYGKVRPFVVVRSDASAPATGSH